MNKSFPLALSSLALTAQASFAAVVFTENFGYPDGPLVGAAGSPWASHSGTAGQSNVLGGAAVVTGAESEDVNANIAGGSGFFFNDGVLTATFDVNFSALPTASGSYFAHFRDSTTFRGRVFATTTGAAPGFFRLAIADTTTTVAPVATDLSLNSNYLVTMSLNVATGRSSLSINGGTVVIATDATTPANVSTFALRQATSIGTMSIDNVVIDATVAAVPEASTAALGLLAGLGLLRRRR